MHFAVGTHALNISRRVAISEEEYIKIKKSAHILLHAFYIEQKFDILISNYFEFEKSILDSTLEGMILGGVGDDWLMSCTLTSNRRIMNIMTAAVTYTDTIPQHINVIFDRNAEKTREVKGYYSHEYDQRLGYRTLCKLRNFVQHQGLPVHNLSHMAMRVARPERNLTQHSVDPYLLTADLREGSFNREILSELEDVGPSHNLKEIVREYVEGASIAHFKLRELIQERIEFAESTIEGHVLDFVLDPTQSGKLSALAAMKLNDDGTVEEKQHMSADISNYRLALTKKNKRYAHLSRSFATSEALDD